MIKRTIVHVLLNIGAYLGMLCLVWAIHSVHVHKPQEVIAAMMLAMLCFFLWGGTQR